MALIKHGNNALSNVTALPSAVPTGKPVLLSTATASASSSIEFTSGIDSNYDIYKFEIINIHPATNDVSFGINFSTDSGLNYNVTKTSTSFFSYHSETGSSSLGYAGNLDVAQGTGDAPVCGFIGNDNDQSGSANVYLFNPSSDTFVKHFISHASDYYGADFSIQRFFAGYGNTTSAINAVRFKFTSGNTDAGTIKMYGISA